MELCRRVTDGGVEEWAYSMELCGRALLMGEWRSVHTVWSLQTCVTDGGVEQCAYSMEPADLCY